MNNMISMTLNDIDLFCDDLRDQERSSATIAQYRRSVLHFWESLPADKRICRENLLAWKQTILQQKAIQTVNCMIAAVNSFLIFLGSTHLKLKTMKCQRKTFSEDELTQEEFQALVAQAKIDGDDQMAVLLYAMSGSGIRVSEVKFLTVEAAREDIDAFSKFTFESQFQKISTGGCISYVEIPNMRHNLEALKDVVRFIYDNIQYAEFNTKSDYCQCCGFDGEIIVNDDNQWECSACHNTDRAKMNVTRCTCDYLGENYWNVGKTKEIKSRVLHL